MKLLLVILICFSLSAFAVEENKPAEPPTPPAPTAQSEPVKADPPFSSPLSQIEELQANATLADYRCNADGILAANAAIQLEKANVYLLAGTNNSDKGIAAKNKLIQQKTTELNRLLSEQKTIVDKSNIQADGFLKAHNLDPKVYQFNWGKVPLKDGLEKKTTDGQVKK